MGFMKKLWKDRISEFPARRQLTKENGASELVTVARSEGAISEEGDAFSAENLNDLEDRIGTGFEEVNSNLSALIQSKTNTCANGLGTIYTLRLGEIVLLTLDSTNLQYQINAGNTITNSNIVYRPETNIRFSLYNHNTGTAYTVLLTTTGTMTNGSVGIPAGSNYSGFAIYKINSTV